MVYVPDALVALILLELAVILSGLAMSLINEFTGQAGLRGYLSPMSQRSMKVTMAGALALCVTGIGCLLYGAIQLLF